MAALFLLIFLEKVSINNNWLYFSCFIVYFGIKLYLYVFIDFLLYQIMAKASLSLSLYLFWSCGSVFQVYGVGLWLMVLSQILLSS